MEEKDFPALYRSADSLSLKSQKHFFCALGVHLSVLVIATLLPLIFSQTPVSYAIQAVVLLFALGCSIYLAKERPDRYWYAGRAVAESIKTITWRYISKAEPFQATDEIAKIEFRNSLKSIVEQNKDICQQLTDYLADEQITSVMQNNRSRNLEERKKYYQEHRIKNQLSWYAKKAKFNKDKARIFFWILIISNIISVILAVAKIVYPTTSFPIDVFIAVSASLLSWIQAKRYTELSASYALTAHEISLINEQSLNATTDEEFSIFVGDAENAFSREHTQWVARRDV